MEDFVHFSGIITTAKKLDRETTDSYALKVKVTDQNTERVSTVDIYLLIFLFLSALHSTGVPVGK